MKLKRIISLALVAVFALLTLTSCGGIEKVNFNGNYKEMTQEDAETLTPLISQKLSEQSVEEIYGGFHIYMETEIPLFGKFTYDAYFTSKEGVTEFSIRMGHLKDEKTSKSEMHYKEGWLYTVTETADGRVTSKHKVSYDVDDFFEELGSNILLEIDFSNFDFAAMQKKGFLLSYARQGGTYKLKASLTEEGYKKSIGSMFLEIEEFKYDTYYAFNKDRFLGAKVDVKVVNNVYSYSNYMELFPFSGSISFPSYLDDAA